MKIRDLILEFREILNRFEYYGAWIDARTKNIIPVTGQGGHSDFIKSKVSAWGIPSQFITSPQDYYTIGFSKNLVRIVHKPTTVLSVEGMAKDIKAVSNIIIASAVQSDIEQVIVSKYSDLEETERTSGKVFNMPKDRNSLVHYIS